MDEQTFFAQLIRSSYDVSQPTIHLISGGQADSRAIYRIEHRDGNSWLARAYHQDTATLAWLAGRAGILFALEPHGFPAPRVIPTRGQEMIGLSEGWCTLVTSYLPGQTVEASQSTLRTMGALLARLHCLPVTAQQAVTVPIGHSWLEPGATIQTALEQYSQISSTTPVEWQDTIAAFCATLHTIAGHPQLPRAMTHGDCHVQNVICSPDDTYSLIDWDCAGLGRAIIDLGRLLLYGQFDSATLGTGLERADRWRVDAILTGYCRYRQPTAEERAALLDAIRFGIALLTATHFLRAACDDWRDTHSARLIRRRQWYQVSAEIAEFAHSRLDKLEM